MKAAIRRQVTTVTTSVVTTKVTTKDIEVNNFTFDSENEHDSDTRDKSRHDWEKRSDDSDDSDDSDE